MKFSIKIFFLLTFGLLISQTLLSQKKDTHNVMVSYKIDTAVKAETEKIINYPPSAINDTIFGYENNLWVSLYINDKLILSTFDSLNIRPYFLSAFWRSKDTVIIMGSFDTNRHQGFLIKLYNGTAAIFYREYHEHYKYYRIATENIYKKEILVPCFHSRLTLNKDPVIDDKVLFGLLELESMDYYSNFENEGEQRERTRIKIYFRSEKKSGAPIE